MLEALVRTRSGASLTELAERCSLAKSTASNLLRTMVVEGLVSYDPETRRYNLGPILVEFGVAAITRTTAVTEARPFMERLAEQTGLACLAIQPMPDGHFVAIAKIESRKDIKVTIEVGERFDQTAPLVDRLAAAWPGPNAATASATGARRLAQIRARGHDAAFGETAHNSMSSVSRSSTARAVRACSSCWWDGRRTDPRGRRRDVGLPGRSGDLDHHRSGAPSPTAIRKSVIQKS